jgi:hypothetical protein
MKKLDRVLELLTQARSLPPEDSIDKLLAAILELTEVVETQQKQIRDLKIGQQSLDHRTIDAIRLGGS